MKIKFYAHASFRLEHAGFAVVTDPYQAGPITGFRPIDEPADVAISCLEGDPFHCDRAAVPGDPAVICALDLPPAGGTVRGLRIEPYPSRERIRWFSLLHGYLPEPFALYHFELGGVRVLHTGDLGWRLMPDFERRLRGRVDVMLTVAGAVHTMEHRDVLRMIDRIEPRVVIPMHFGLPPGTPGARLHLEPVERFLEHFPPEQVERIAGSELELTPRTLPPSRRVVALEPSRSPTIGPERRERCIA